ncbi:TonB C-terminal domain-containing protein [Candidatus Obscuribacterales bacterium]|nr:TonB C-terminal domain-containing protein [Candidatus Obscuribacterales bacterium]MBX3151030.1 TonB C-terminal domain-containing protein [Candidatus Obscuribacterales bacterium]
MKAYLVPALALLVFASLPSAVAQSDAPKAQQSAHPNDNVRRCIADSSTARTLDTAEETSLKNFNFEVERKKIVDKITELEKLGAGIKPYTQALADIDELAKKNHSNTELESAVSRINKALADQHKARESLTLTFGSKTTTELPNDKFKPFMTEVQRRIKQYWHPPKGTESKRVTVRFKIDRNGRLLANKIEKSASPGLDAAALKAVEIAAPFPPLPKGSPEDVDVQFTFDYNVFKGRPHPYAQRAHYLR